MTTATTTSTTTSDSQAQLSNPAKAYQLSIAIPFPSHHHAEIIHQVLLVDAELKPQSIERDIQLVSPSQLDILFRSTSLRQLRTSVNALMDQLGLISDTLDQFDMHTPKEKKELH